MSISNEVVNEYLTFYRDLNLNINFDGNKSIQVCPYKFGYIITVYETGIAKDQCFANSWTEAVSKFEEITEEKLKKCSERRRGQAREKSSKYEQLELTF